MNAAEILTIAKKWKVVFDNLKINPDVDQQVELEMLARINARFIIVLQAENYLNKTRTEFASPPSAMPRLSPLNLHFLHINRVLDHYPSISMANLLRWAAATPYQALNNRNLLRALLLLLAQLVLIARALFLLWTNQATFAALLTLSHLSLFIVPLVVLGLWMLYDKCIHFPYDNHSFNLAHMPSSLQKDPILSGMPNSSGASSGLSFFEKSDNAGLLETINTEYQRVYSLGR